MKTASFVVLVAAAPLALANSNSTTPGGPNASMTSLPASLTSTTSDMVSSANYSSSLSASTTTPSGSSPPTVVVSTSTASAVASGTQIILTTTAPGGATTMTSVQFVGAPQSSAANQPAASTSQAGQLQAGASSLQSGIQGAAVAALVAVCGIMGTL